MKIKQTKIKSIILKLFMVVMLLFITSCNVDNSNTDNNDNQKETPSEQKEDTPTIKEKTEGEILYYDINTIDQEVVIEDENNLKEYLNRYNNLSVDEQAKVTNINIINDLLDKIANNKKELIEEQIIAYLDDLNPICDIETSQVAFEKTHRITVNGTKYIVNIKATSSNYDYLDDNLRAYHSSCDKKVNVSFYYYCQGQGLDFNGTKEMEFTVMGYQLKDLSNKTICAGYFYGDSTLEEVDLQTLDIIKFSFGDVILKDGTYSITICNTGLIDNFVTKAHANGIRVTLAIGGWKDDSSGWNQYKTMVRTTGEKREQVIKVFIDTLKKYHFDGIDMDWEYPASTDKAYFTEFMKDLKQAMLDYDSNQILSIAVGSGTSTGKYYDFAGLKDCVDYFDLMSYDFTYTGYQTTVHLCNLYSSTYTSSEATSGMKYLASFGINKKKIIIGAAFYAHYFKVTSANNHGLGQNYTTRGYTTFTDIKKNYLTNPNYVRYYDSVAQCYYLFSETDMMFVTYDDPDAIKLKCQYVINNGYGGIMFWCHSEDTTKTLITAINNVLIK